jgi:hypothetical protein
MKKASTKKAGFKEKPSDKKKPVSKKSTKATSMRKVISNAKPAQDVPTLKEELLSAHGNSLTVWKDAQDIMEEFKIRPRTLHSWRKQKKIPYTKEGRKILYNRTLFEKILMMKCIVGE